MNAQKDIPTRIEIDICVALGILGCLFHVMSLSKCPNGHCQRVVLMNTMINHFQFGRDGHKHLSGARAHGVFGCDLLVRNIEMNQATL